MKIYYMIDENGNYPSADGSTHFRRLSGRALYRYLNTPEGSSKVFNVDVDDNGDEIGFELPPEKVKEYLVEKRRKQYVQDCRREAGYVMVSLTADYSAKDGDLLSYEEVVADDSENIAAVLTHRADLDTLRHALSTLSADESELMYKLYLSADPMTEAEVAEVLGVSQQAIHKRKMAILKKIKSFF